MPTLAKMNRMLWAAAFLGAAGFALALLPASAAARSGPVGLRLPVPAASKLQPGAHPAAPPAAQPAPREFHPPAPYASFYSYYASYAPIDRARLG